VLPRFRAALGERPAVGVLDVGFAAEVPAGPDIVALAVAPPIRVTAAHVAALPELRIVAAASAGYDHIDVAAVAAAGACVTHTPGYCDIEVADHAIAMTGALLRRLHVADAMVRGGVWSSRAVGARRITGSAIGVVGLGRIGALVAQRAASLGMRVLAWAPRTPEAKVRAAGAQPCGTLEELLKASDVVTLHLPLAPETKGIIDAGALAAMRPGSCLVNCGRGELVDHVALRAALDSGHLAGAALDVLDMEPPPENHVAFGLPNTIITPHLAWLSPESEFASYEMAARAIADVLAGQPPQNPVYGASPPPGSGHAPA
jgi:D-3-phosphoglycerate dehydrogenase / 2-oxoglutarate reductase